MRFTINEYKNRLCKFYTELSLLRWHLAQSWNTKSSNRWFSQLILYSLKTTDTEQQDLNRHSINRNHVKSWNVCQMNICIPSWFPLLVLSVFQTVLHSDECSKIFRLSALSCTLTFVCPPRTVLSAPRYWSVWCHCKIAWNMPLSEVFRIVSLRYLAIFCLKDLYAWLLLYVWTETQHWHCKDND